MHDDLHIAALGNELNIARIQALRFSPQRAEAWARPFPAEYEAGNLSHFVPVAAAPRGTSAVSLALLMSLELIFSILQLLFFKYSAAHITCFLPSSNLFSLASQIA